MPRNPSTGTPPKTTSLSRDKGHRFEREIVNVFKNLGYSKACTTRFSSKQLDNASVDIDNIPYYVQCKSGYKRGLNYSAILAKMKTQIKEIKDKIEYPLIILHKKTHKDFLAVVEYDFFIKLLKTYDELQRQSKNVPE